jgi:hypothetical protein
MVLNNHSFQLDVSLKGSETFLGVWGEIYGRQPVARDYFWFAVDFSKQYKPGNDTCVQHGLMLLAFTYSIAQTPPTAGEQQNDHRPFLKFNVFVLYPEFSTLQASP